MKGLVLLVAGLALAEATVTNNRIDFRDTCR